MSAPLTSPVSEPSTELGVVILAPFGQDAVLMAQMLTSEGIAAQSVSTLEAFVQKLPDFAAGLLTIEALSPEAIAHLQSLLHAQPPWSDVPLVLLTAHIDAATYALLARTLGNVTIIQRPLEAASLLTVIRAALRARQKQYEVRGLLEAAQTRQEEIHALNTRLRRSMRETHHRVKNNLQVISAMIEMQVLEHNAEKTVPLEEFERLKAHVHTLSIVHDLLTLNLKEEESAQFISTKAILEKLLPMLQRTAWKQSVRYFAEEVELTSKQCIALSLVLNELVSNSLKHGKKQAEVFFKVDEGSATLAVYDDGAGFPEDFNPKTAANTGLELVESLVHTDLQGTIQFSNQSQGGGKVVVTFPLPKDEG